MIPPRAMSRSSRVDGYSARSSSPAALAGVSFVQANGEKEDAQCHERASSFARTVDEARWMCVEMAACAPSLPIPRRGPGTSSKAATVHFATPPIGNGRRTRATGSDPAVPPALRLPPQARPQTCGGVLSLRTAGPVSAIPERRPGTLSRAARPAAVGIATAGPGPA